VLLDETTYNYRVIAVDKYGNDAPARNYSIYIVTPPLPPDPHIKIIYVKPDLLISHV
jgi:hypothetical protein